MSKHITEKVNAALIELDNRVEDVKAGFTKMVDQGKVYPLDTLAIGAIKRCVSQTSAFKLLVEAGNLMCARALLRLQIGNGLRFYAAFLVDEPHQFAVVVLQGKRIDKIKDSNGIHLRDSYLVEKLKPDYPWLEEVYKITSGYIHLSDRAMFRPVSHVNDENRTICPATIILPH